MRYENIPYRRYWNRRYGGKLEIVFTAAGKRVMTRIGRATRVGKAVAFTHQIVGDYGTAYNGMVYDTISATIED